MKDFLCLLYFFMITLVFSSSLCTCSSQKTSIIFATIGRSTYNFDIYTLPITQTQSSTPFNSSNELKITDGISVNFNGSFPNSTSSTSKSTLNLIYVTKRNGTSNIHLDTLSIPESLSRPGSRSALELELLTRVQVPLLRVGANHSDISMKDRPSLVGQYLIYVSTHENSGVARASWAAVYSTHFPSGSTRRLTPKGVADFSPAVSPSGVWTAVASFGESGWGGEFQELGTDIYVFLTRDGSDRVKVVEHGRWPCWVDDQTIYFHRKNKNDGWWSVYRAILPRVGKLSTESVVVERVTPPGLHAFTPATSPGNKKFIALATRRPGSNYRHIELFDLVNKEFKEVTKPVSPSAHHYNPFMSPDSTRVGYHKCRGEGQGGKEDHLLLENIENPEPDISMFRIEGAFPSFSPSGDRIAYADLDAVQGIYVVNADGSNRRQVYKGRSFATAWDQVRKGVIYTSAGPALASEGSKVDIISINMDEDEPSYKILTKGGANNAFPSSSPDGKGVVFRSGRSSHKNLYIMDAIEGEAGGLKRLTEGRWTDTMANWSPDGEWIAFASDRELRGSFEIFMVHPNGTGLHKVIQSGFGGSATHPWFSPDMNNIVFTSDYARVSAEPISNPNQYRPFGDIFIANVDGSGIRRMTDNSYEDGTPTWGPRFLNPVDLPRPLDGPLCVVDDYHWLNVKAKVLVENTFNSSIRVQCTNFHS